MGIRIQEKKPLPCYIHTHTIVSVCLLLAYPKNVSMREVEGGGGEERSEMKSCAQEINK